MTTQDTDRPPTSGFWPRPLRGRPRWVVVTVVVALVAALTAGGWWLRSALAGPQAEAGDFLGGSRPVGLVDFATVRLPWGDLKLATGRPTDHVPDPGLFSDRFDANVNEIDPPDDGSWIAIKLEPDIDYDSPLFRSRPDATIPATTVSVVSGGRTIPIARAAGGGKQTTAQVVTAQLAPAVEGYLALPDRPRDVHLRVEFDGERQEAHLYSDKIESGRAAPLYRQTEDVEVACSRPVVPGYREGYRIAGNCVMDRLRLLPYVAGLGWAEPGRSWLVTTIRTNPPPQLLRTSATGERGTYYAKQSIRWTSRLRYGGLAPRAQADFNTVKTGVFRDVENPEQFVFDVASTDRGKATFTLITRFTVRLSNSDESPGLPVEEQVTATRTIRP